MPRHNILTNDTFDAILAQVMLGREILYPIATVIVGGLLASTLVEFFVRPALFWTFGRKTAQRLIEREQC